MTKENKTWTKESTVTDHKEVHKIYMDMIDKDQVDDRREYDVDMLMKMYDLERYEGQLLWYMIQSVTSPTYIITDWDPELVHINLGEAVHQGFDGWSDSDVVVIMAFLADVALACSVS